MSYKYLEDIATADIAFQAWGATLEEVFSASADATMNVMIESLESIEARQERKLTLENGALDMLLFDLLQELIFYKDAENLFFSSLKIRVSTDKKYSLSGQLEGEKIDPKKHELLVDVKAVTFHKFEVKFDQKQWLARVVLDV